MNGPLTELTSTMTTAAHSRSAPPERGRRNGISPNGIQTSRCIRPNTSIICLRLQVRSST